MQKIKTVFKTAWPYQKDTMNLPVASVEDAIPFYVSILGFEVLIEQNEPIKSVTLGRDQVRIGLSENGGDPTQDGCFFEVDNVETAFEELKANGLEKASPDFGMQQYGETTWKVFFVVAPDGLCYCFGQRQ